MTILLRPFILFLLTDLPIFLCVFCMVDGIFTRRTALKPIVLCFMVSVTVHAYVAVSDTLMFFKGYFILGVFTLLPVIFYKGEPLSKRLSSGVMMVIFSLFMDFLMTMLYLIVTDTPIILGFSIERQIYYGVMVFILYPLLYKPVKHIICRFLDKSMFFFYQNFLLITLIVVEIGVVNYMMAYGIKEDASFMLASAETVTNISWILGFGVLDMLIIYTLNRLDKSYKTEREISLNKQKKTLRQGYYMMIEKHYQQSRELAHDLKNHVLTLEHLYEAGGYKEASHYADHTLKEIEEAIKKEAENTRESVLYTVKGDEKC